MTDVPVDTSSDRFRKAHAAADEFGLTREDRLDLAEYLLRRDVRSWKDLTEAQLGRLLDAFDGCGYINTLIVRGVGLRRSDADERRRAEPVGVDRL